jgi:hypothetical protein
VADTNTRSTLENVLGTLRAFKQEWHRNEERLVPFDVCQSTGLCPDVLIEISQYLWLNDAINAFSASILPLFRSAHAKLHLNNPSERFLKMILEHLDPRQIISLRARNDSRPLFYRTCFPVHFDGLVILTLLNREYWYTIEPYLSSLSSVRNLCLLYHGDMNVHSFQYLRLAFLNRITTLRIRCAEVGCAPSWTRTEWNSPRNDSTMTSFIFDTEYHPSQRNTSHVRDRSLHSNVLNPMIHYIQSLVNVQRVRFITSQYRIERLLEVYEWRKVISECVRLDRVIIQLVDDGDFAREAHDIQQELRRIRPEITFRVEKRLV